MPVKLRQEEALARFHETHGDRYDYSRVEYVKSNAKVLILCREHGPFEQIPSAHWGGSGCPTCWFEKQRRTKSMDFETFASRARERFEERYTYDPASWDTHSNMQKKMLRFWCPEHGQQEMRPESHIASATGCGQCSRERFFDTRRLSDDEFAARAREHHGDAYTYERARYQGAFEEVTVTCSEHGDFSVIATNHLRKQGCPECAKREFTAKRSWSFEGFLGRVTERFGDRFEYDRSSWDDSITMLQHRQIRIRCPEHGWRTQKPMEHLLSPTGCAPCSVIEAGLKRRKNHEEIVAKLKEVHGDLYSYEKAVYTRMVDKIIVGCADHGDFSIGPSKHLEGQGCPRCSVRGFQPDLPAIVYYLRIDAPDGALYKIGITNLTVWERYSNRLDQDRITILHE